MICGEKGQSCLAGATFTIHLSFNKIPDNSLGLTDLNLCGQWTVKVGRSGGDVGHMRWGVRGGPVAVLLQDTEVGLGVKVCAPHQHLYLPGKTLQ